MTEKRNFLTTKALAELASVRQPIAVTHQAASLDPSINGAADKLTRLIEHTLGRPREQRSHQTYPKPKLDEES